MEKIDIYDCFNKHIGTEERDIAHRKGLWHRTMNFLVIDPENKTIIFQDNSESLDIDDKFFLKVNGGHLNAGEDNSAAVRELREELGLEIDYSDLHYIGINQTSVDFGSDFKLREFMYYYIASKNNILDSIKFQDGEVGRIFIINIEQGLRLLLEEIDDLSVEVSNLKSSKLVTLSRRHFKNFTDDNLYLRFFLAAKQFIDGIPTKYIKI